MAKNDGISMDTKDTGTTSEQASHNEGAAKIEPQRGSFNDGDGAGNGFFRLGSALVDVT